MNGFSEAIRRQIGQQQRLISQPRVGIISSSDNITSTVRVLLQPEGVLTGWLPVMTVWSGTGWGLSCPLSPGDQVILIFQEGSVDHGIVLGTLYSDKTNAPEARIGELVLKHQSGTSIKLTNEGRVLIEGDLFVSGYIHDGHGPISRLRGAHNAHIHRLANGVPTSTPSVLD